MDKVWVFYREGGGIPFIARDTIEFEELLKRKLTLNWYVLEVTATSMLTMSLDDAVLAHKRQSLVREIALAEEHLADLRAAHNNLSNITASQ